MQWINEPDNYKITNDSILIEAGPNTNLFHSPSSNRRDHNFPFYYAEYAGDFVIKCKVAPEFVSGADQGDIIIWQDENKWIKLAYELSEGYPTIVSIVNNGTSDDCNGCRIEGSVWLLACRKENTFALHYSVDGIKWNLVRIFNFELDETLKVGFSAQCPSGEKCNVLFEEIYIGGNSYKNVRNINK